MDLIVKFGEGEVKGLNRLNIFVRNIVIFRRALRFSISGLEPINQLFPSGKDLWREIKEISCCFPFKGVEK
jgi:hypothetical protein